MTFALTPRRAAELIALRDRLNRAGDYNAFTVCYETGLPADTYPRNGSTWNQKRIKARNRINARLRRSIGNL